MLSTLPFLPPDHHWYLLCGPVWPFVGLCGPVARCGIVSLLCLESCKWQTVPSMAVFSSSSGLPPPPANSHTIHIFKTPPLLSDTRAQSKKEREGRLRPPTTTSFQKAGEGGASVQEKGRDECFLTGQAPARLHQGLASRQHSELILLTGN